MNAFDVPIAFITFNRPEPTKKSFKVIRSTRPSRLFLVSDAARTDHQGEDDLVSECREITSEIDWPCDVTRIYADQNMGCGQRISSAITTAMRDVDRLIILEDDCVADPSFFTFCDDLLERYQNDERVMAITGNNFQGGIRRSTASYYFSKYPHCWGWATWRRAWQHFDLRIPAWPEFRQQGQLRAFCDNEREVEYWTEIFDRVHAGKSHSWAFPWVLSCWMNHGLTAIPERNLVTNIGFGEDATHTRKTNHQANVLAESLDDLIHPNQVHRNVQADRYTDDHIFTGTVRRGPLKKLEKAIRKLRNAA
jgi:hypothetical protein